MIQNFSLTAFSSVIIPVSLALLAGAVVPFQAGANSALARTLGHPLWAALFSLSVSLVVVAAVILVLRIPMPRFSAAAGAPVWIWFGGVAGVIYVSLAIMLATRLGMTNFIIMVVAGQMLASMLIDHWGLMGMMVKPVNFGRIAGALLVGAGMLISIYSSSSVNKLAAV